MLHTLASTPAAAPLRRAALRAARLTYPARPQVLVRHEFPYMLNSRGLLGLAFEIGVKDAGFSSRILSTWRGRRLVSVDPWLAAPPEEYVDVANVSQGEHDAFYESSRQLLAPFGERSDIWRMTSVEAAERVQPACADFVYLDARHDHDSVKEDLEAWVDKVRPGAIFAGHDYVDGEFESGVFGVKSAVDEFFAARGVPVRNTPLELDWPSWWVRMPGR